MQRLENIGQTYQLAMRIVARTYGPVERFIGNPYFPRDVRDSYGNHTVEIGRSINEFDVSRRMHLLNESDDLVLARFDPNEAKQLALIKPTHVSFGGLYILPSQIETDGEKSAVYGELKRKIARFVFTLAVTEAMLSQISLVRPVFSKLAKSMQIKAVSMTYENYKEYLVNDFFKKYPSPIDYIRHYMKETGENDILKLVNYDDIEQIVDEELMSRYKELEQYETPEAALVNLLDSILADDKFIFHAPEGGRTGQVEKQIGHVQKEPGGIEFVESVAQRLHLRHSKMPPECLTNNLVNGTVARLIGHTLARYTEVTGIDLQ